MREQKSQRRRSINASKNDAGQAVSMRGGQERNVANDLPLNLIARVQCTLTASNSWLRALASAASRVSVSMIGVPFALCSENSLMPGAIFGACGNRLATSSERIALT